MQRIILSSLLFLLLFSADAFAGKRYWVSASAKNWTTSNWSTTSGGAAGATTPGNTDTVYFDGGGTGGCGLSTTIDIKRIEVSAGYTGTLTQSSSPITVGTGNAVFGGGTFAGSSGTITINGSMTISGTAFTSTSTTLTVVGDFTLSSGSFTHNSGTTVFNTSNTISGTIGFYNLTFTQLGAAAATHAISNTITANNTLTLGGSNPLTLNTGTIDTKGNITCSNSGTGGGGSATVTITGTATVTLTGNSTVGQGALPNVEINKSGGTLNLASTISVAGNWTWTAGTLSVGSSVVAFLNTCTITGSHTLFAVTFKSNSPATYTIASGTTLTMNSTFTTDGTGALTFSTGTIDCKGSLTLNNSGTGGGGDALITITGGSFCTITGNSTVGQSNLPKVTVNKTGPGASVALASTISIANNFTVTAGTFTYGTSTVAFVAPLTVSGTFPLNNLTFTSNSTATFTLTSATITVNGTLTTDGIGALTFTGGTIDTKSTIDVSNSGTGGGGTTTITLTGTNSLTFTGNSTIGNGALPKVTINKGGGTLTLASTISVTNDWTWTAGTISAGSSTVAFIDDCTITGSHTLNNVVFQSGSATVYAIANTLTVSGTLTTSGSGSLTFNTGTIDATGSVVISNTGTAGGGSATITITGGGTVNFDGAASANQGIMPNVTINKSGGSVTLLDVITVAGNWDCVTNTYLTEGSSTVYFTGTKTIAGTHQLFNVTFDGGTHTVSNTLTVSGLLKYVGSTAIIINTGIISAQGNITLENTGTGGGGSGRIVIDGTGSQTMLGIPTVVPESKLPHVQINKSSGTLTLDQVIVVNGNWVYTTGTVAPGTSTVAFQGTKDISGSHTLNNAYFAGSTATFTIVTGTTLTVTGTLTVGGTSAMTLNTGTIDVKGNMLFSNTHAGTGGSATISITGTGSQSLTGGSTAGVGAMPDVYINKTSGTLTLIDVISCAGDWNYADGTVDAITNSSTVAFMGSHDLDAHESGYMPFYNLNIYSGTRTLTDHLDVNNHLTIAASATLSAASYTIYVGGNWGNLGTFTAGTSTVIFDGVKYNTIARPSATESFYNLTFNRGYDVGVKKAVSLGSPVDVTNALTMTQGRVITTSSFYLHLTDNATSTAGSDVAYVDGPMRKTGNEAFVFPLGDTVWADTASYHPLGITAPGSASDRFEAIYIPVGQAYGATIEDTLESISDCEYWTLQRQVGSSTVSVGVGWNRNSCDVDNYDDLRLAGWDGSEWEDLGDVTVAVDGFYRGDVTLVGTLSFTVNPRPIVIARPKSSTPYAVLQTQLTGGYHTVYNGKLLFKYDELYNETGNLTYTIYDDYHRPVASNTISPGVLIAGTVVTGDNRYLLNLMDCDITPNGSLGAGTFLLEVVNDKNERRFLLIKHITTISIYCPNAPLPD